MIMQILSYILVFALGIVSGLMISVLLAASRHTIDETQHTN